MNIFDFDYLLYVDPGAGALILQMLMAGLFGSLFFVRRIRDRILGIFGKGSSDKSISKESEISETNGETDINES